MDIRRIIFWIGVFGSAVCVFLYVGLLAAWPDLPPTKSAWALVFYARPDTLIVWAVGLLLIFGARLLAGRLSAPSTLATTLFLIAIPAIWLTVTEAVNRTSVDGWPSFGDLSWRTYIAPLYAEYAVTLFLGFVSIVALTASKSVSRRVQA